MLADVNYIRTGTARFFNLVSNSRRAILAGALCVTSSSVFAVGFDQLGVLNGPQEAAADAWQGKDDPVTGQRPGIDPSLPNAGLCQRMNAAPDPRAGVASLATRCLELVETADPDAIDPTLNLGGAPADVPGWLQQIVPEEAEIMGSGSTDTAHDQLANVGNRLQFLRTGTSTLAVSGIHLTGDSLTGGAAGGDDYSRWGLFVNGSYGSGDKDQTFNEAGFDYDAYGITAGVDYRVNAALVAGIAVGFSKSEVEAEANDDTYDTDGNSIILYGSYFKELFYVEGSLTYGAYEHEGERNIAYGAGARRILRTAESDTDSNQLAWSLATGYNNSIARFNYSLFARVEGVDADIDGYDESGSGNPAAVGGNEWAMRVEDQEIESLQLVLGAHLAYALSASFGVIQPYVSAEAHHEFEDDARTVRSFYLNDPFFIDGDRSFPVELTTDKPDEDFFVISVGSSFVLKSGNQLFINYDTLVGMANVNSQAVTIGVRFEM